MFKEIIKTCVDNLFNNVTYSDEIPTDLVELNEVLKNLAEVKEKIKVNQKVIYEKSHRVYYGVVVGYKLLYNRVILIEIERDNDKTNHDFVFHYNVKVRES